MWSVTNYFLVNLTLADLLMSTLNCIPSFIFMRDRSVRDHQQGNMFRLPNEGYFILMSLIWVHRDVGNSIFEWMNKSQLSHLWICFIPLSRYIKENIFYLQSLGLWSHLLPSQQLRLLHDGLPQRVHPPGHQCGQEEGGSERSLLVLQYIRQRYFITAGYLIYRPLIHWGYRRQDSLYVWDSQAQVTCQESEALSDIIQCPFYFNLDKARALYLCIRKCYFNRSSLLKDSNERG